MDLAKRYKADPEKVEAGVEHVIDGTTFILSYYNTSATQIIFQSNLQKCLLIMPLKKATTEAMKETLVENVIIGWFDLEEKGVVTEFSKEEARRILSEYIGLDQELMDKSSDIEKYKREVAEEAEGK